MQKVTWNNKSTPPPEQTSEPNRPDLYKDTYEGPRSGSKAETSTIDQVRQGLGLEEPKPQEYQDPWTQLLGSMKAQQGTPTGITEDPITGELTYETPYPVPDIDELISNPDFPVNLPTLDEIEGLYNEARQMRQEELNQYQELIQEGELPPPEVDKLRRLIAFLEESIRKIDENLSKIPTVRENLRQSYKDELADLKEFGIWYAGLDQEDLPIEEINAKIEGLDRNKDGWLGQPDAPGSFKVRMKKDSEQLVITDRESRIVEFDPRTGMVLSQYLLDPTYGWTIGSTELAVTDGIGDEDLTLRLTAQVELGEAYEIAVPEYIWVEADVETGEPKEIDDEDGYGRYVAKEFTEGAGGITQEPPEPDNLENWVQVRVTMVHVTSKSSSSSSENGGNDQVISFMNGDTTLATVRVTGGETIAADKFILALTGGQRTSPVAIDASNMTSDAQVSDFWGKLDSEYPGKGFGGKRIDSGRDVRDVDTVGIIIEGLRGDINGTIYNDFIRLPNAEVDQYEGEGAERKYNPLYATTIDGGGGYDAVLGGKGDHYMKNVELVWIKAGKNDINHIQTSGLTPNSSPNIQDFVNPHIAVYIKGNTGRGETLIDNAGDSDPGNNQWNDKDDSFDVENGAKFSNTLDRNIKQGARAGSDNPSFSADIPKEVDEIGQQIQERLEQGPEAGELADGVEDLIDAPYYLKTQNDQDSFFAVWETQFGSKDPDADPADADPADVEGP